RVWAHYFGVGLVEPVDNFSAANPPSNERLLDALAAEFTRTGYDIRRLERTILTSRTYQLSAIANETNARDRTNHSRAVVRRMVSGVVVDALKEGVGGREAFGPDVPPGSRAIGVAPNRVRDRHLATVFRIFGRPERTAPCDCERSSEPALPQTLFLMTDPKLLKKITGGRAGSLPGENTPERPVAEGPCLAAPWAFAPGGGRASPPGHRTTRGRRAPFRAT